MKIIKKYKNRKMYDTDSSKHITLSEIERMILADTEFKVVCNKTQLDITSHTIIEVLVQGERENRFLLPVEELRNIVQNGGSFTEFLVRKEEEEAQKMS